VFALAVYTILNDAEESPEKWLMVGASVLNASVDLICIMLMDKANPMKEIIPWLFGKSESTSSEVFYTPYLSHDYLQKEFRLPSFLFGFYIYYEPDN
jgi:hypothetical protein